MGAAILKVKKDIIFCITQKVPFGRNMLLHYENTPIKIYWKLYYQKMKIFK